MSVSTKSSELNSSDGKRRNPEPKEVRCTSDHDSADGSDNESTNESDDDDDNDVGDDTDSDGSEDVLWPPLLPEKVQVWKRSTIGNPEYRGKLLERHTGKRQSLANFTFSKAKTTMDDLIPPDKRTLLLMDKIYLEFSVPESQFSDLLKLHSEDKMTTIKWYDPQFRGKDFPSNVVHAFVFTMVKHGIWNYSDCKMPNEVKHTMRVLGADEATLKRSIKDIYTKYRAIVYPQIIDLFLQEWTSLVAHKLHSALAAARNAAIKVENGIQFCYMAADKSFVTIEENFDPYRHVLNGVIDRKQITSESPQSLIAEIEKRVVKFTPTEVSKTFEAFLYAALHPSSAALSKETRLDLEHQNYLDKQEFNQGHGMKSEGLPQACDQLQSRPEDDDTYRQEIAIKAQASKSFGLICENIHRALSGGTMPVANTKGFQPSQPILTHKLKTNRLGDFHTRPTPTVQSRSVSSSEKPSAYHEDSENLHVPLAHSLVKSANTTDQKSPSGNAQIQSRQIKNNQKLQQTGSLYIAAGRPMQTTSSLAAKQVQGRLDSSICKRKAEPDQDSVDLVNNRTGALQTSSSGNWPRHMQLVPDRTQDLHSNKKHRNA